VVYINKNLLKLLTIILTILVVFTIGCFEENKIKEETEIDVDIDVSVDKTSFNSGEKINIIVEIKNNMDKTFPFDDYSLELGYVNKSSYDSGGVWALILINDSIVVNAGDNYNESIIWDTSERYITPGKYYIRFEIHKNSGGFYTIVDYADTEVTVS